MSNDTNKSQVREAFGPDTIEQFMRDQVREKLGESSKKKSCWRWEPAVIKGWVKNAVDICTERGHEH